MASSVWYAILCVAFAAAFAYIAWINARNPHLDERYASRAMRIPLWLMALALLGIGLSFIFDDFYGDMAMLLMVLALIWIGLLILSLLIAPSWAARAWFGAHIIAAEQISGRPISDQRELERQTRVFSYALICVLSATLVGYWIAMRWLGIWLLPAVFFLGLMLAIVGVFWPRAAHFLLRALPKGLRP